MLIGMHRTFKFRAFQASLLWLELFVHFFWQLSSGFSKAFLSQTLIIVNDCHKYSTNATLTWSVQSPDCNAYALDILQDFYSLTVVWQYKTIWPSFPKCVWISFSKQVSVKLPLKKEDASRIPLRLCVCKIWMPAVEFPCFQADFTLLSHLWFTQM